jgi:hypothetical protein
LVLFGPQTASARWAKTRPDEAAMSTMPTIARLTAGAQCAVWKALNQSGGTSATNGE